MARGPRNYPLEYERRLRIEGERARRYGVPFDRGRARGHPSPGHLSASELRVGRLKVTTLEWYADLNHQLRRLGFGSDAVNLANRRGVALQFSKAGNPYTIGFVAPEIIDRMSHASRQIFFGY